MKYKIAVIVILALLFSFASCSREVNKRLADYSGDVDEIWQTRADARKRIADYHWFEDTVASIEAAKANISLRINSGESFSDLTPEIQIINRWISEYNSKSRQYDRVLWKAADLPEKLELVSSEDDL
jgi:hypothetical protein